MIRSKLVYSLEAVQLPTAMLKKIDSIQFKGLRKILNIQHPFINRANTNISILRRANEIKNPTHTPGKDIRSFSQYVQLSQEALLKHTVRASNDDPLREAMLIPNSPQPNVTNNRRIGRPKTLWVHDVYKRIWTKTSMGSAVAFATNLEQNIDHMGAAIKLRNI